MKYFILLLTIFALFEKTYGHGLLLDPVGRSSRWRTDSTAPKNYNDYELFCGGFVVQHNVNGGKCGICGDDYRDPTPRDNELGGKYGGTGVIVRTYENSFTAKFNFNISANHLGYVYFEICNMDRFGLESEKCFTEHRLKFVDGSDKFYIGTARGAFNVVVVLPTGLNCDHCIVRWTYKTGNNWGDCGNGTGALGCGKQETFKSCADVRISVPKARFIEGISKEIY